jgi:tetratricopeptide (TPR) repeat protein
MSSVPLSAGTVTASPVARRTVRPSVGPRLRIVLWTLFGLVALLGANSVYLTAVTALDWWTGQTFENWFYHWMFLGHLVLGLLIVLPFVVFAVVHVWNTRERKNKRAIRVGWALLVGAVIVLVSGLLLVRIGGFDLRQPELRSAVYWAHVLSPLFCLWLYWLHRLVGPKIRWKWGAMYLGAVALSVGGMLWLHNQDPRRWNAAGPASGAQYFFPSLAKTSTGNFIPAHVLDNDEYCQKCHQDAYAGWFHSAHHFSSFNNPAYLASVRETREVSLQRDGDVRGSRFCAGCHDPVPFFSGAFDDPKFDDVNHPTAHAGITCTTCHAVTHINSTRGNADFTIEEPQHYPFAFSENAFLQWINNQLIKAKPEFHKKTFLKDFHKTEEFCSTCHKVHLPFALNHYKEFLRGQNHYDTYLLSGVSGHGARSFYYPERAVENCAGCHMPLQPSQDFGAKRFANADKPSIHNHLFPSANTGIAWLKGSDEAVRAHQEFLQEKVRVDIFGVRDGGEIDSPLVAPLRPEVPTLKPGKKYLLEAVIRTMKLGHPFTQGTADSNEVWLDVTVTSGDRVIGRSGGIDEQSHVDPWSHFVNVFMLDKNGRRIDRRNAQDIFVPLYNNQIPPGAASTAHYGFEVPADLAAPVTITVKLQYRKFDQTYMEYVASKARPGDEPLRGHTPGQPYRNPLPITTMASDTITLPVEGVDQPVENAASTIPVWQRWNDYGIGLLLKGKAELRQAADAFAQVEALGRYDGPLNLARAYYAEGRLDEATAALKRAAEAKDPPAPWWTVSWLTGVVNREQGNLTSAEENFRAVLSPPSADLIARGFDFRRDYEVINLLGQTLFDQAKQIRSAERQSERDGLLRDAESQFLQTLSLDSENVTAHYALSQIYGLLHETAAAEHHRLEHQKYKADDNARDQAVAAARQRYPAANHASEPVVIYSLQRDGAPGLTPPSAPPTTAAVN